jgi:hypothetical protein
MGHHEGRQNHQHRHAPLPEVAPADLLDRVLGGGVVVSSEVTVTVADVDLVRVKLADLFRAFSVVDHGGVV